MSRFMFVVAGALLLGVGAQAPVSRVSSPASVVPAPWLQGDPADSIYRVAREALNRGRYREALQAFRTLERKYPRSGYVADGLYWQAFALYRLGGPGNLRDASARLEDQARRFAQAATRGDADALAVRINSELARYGDASANADILREAERAARAPVVAPVPPVPPHAPRPALAMVHDRDDDCGPDNDAKIMALHAIMRNDPDRAVPIVEKVMARRDSGSACLRQQALFVLATSNNPAANRLLLQAVINDPDKSVREGAVFWLARTDDPRAVTVLDSVLRTSQDQDVQQAAIFALSTKNDPKARDILRSYITKNGVSDDLAGMALFQLARDPQTTDAQLKQLYAQARTTEMKQQILVALMARPDKDADWLTSIATSKTEDREVRQQAVMVLVHSNVSTANLLKLFDAMPQDDEMQGMMLMLMSQRPNDPAITDRLITIAKTSKDKELRQQAIFWLGQSKDPRATRLLEEMLEQ